jgi:flagellar hook assembly protein FlgD
MHRKAVVHFNLPTPQRVSMRVYDVAGQLVRVLSTNEVYPAGDHNLTWDGAGETGRPAPTGVYFIRTSTGLGEITCRLTILR